MALNFLNDGYFAGKVGIGAISPTVGLQLGNSTLGQTQLAIFNSEGGGEVGLTIQSRTNRAKLRVADNDSNAYVVAEAGKSFFGTSANGDATNITVLTSGNVGIGTTSPSVKLSVEKPNVVNTAVDVLKLGDDTNGLVFKSFFDASGIAWRLNKGLSGINMMTFTQPGNVGIGTTSPSLKLHVKNDNDYAAKFGGTGGGDYSIEIGQTGTNSSAGFNATGTGGSMLFKIADSEAMRINNAGNVGIGLTSPGAKLDVLNEARVSFANANQYTLRITNTDGNPRILADGSAAHLIFGTTPNGSTTAIERMRIQNDGKVGIGTTLPATQLNVVDSTALTAQFSGYSFASAANNARAASGSLRLGDGSGSTGLLIDYTDQGQTLALIKNLYTVNVLSELRIQSPFISLYTGTTAAEKMRITPAGGVSFGSTGTAYGTSGQVLTSAGNASPTWTTPTTGTVTGTGVAGRVTFWTGTNTIDSNGAFTWDNTNKFLGISHWTTVTATPAVLLHLFGKDNDIDVPQIRIEGRENPGDTRMDIAVKDASVRFNLVEGPSGDVNAGYGKMIFKTNANPSASFPTRGGFLFEVGETTVINALTITNQGNVGIGATNPAFPLEVENASTAYIFSETTGAATSSGYRWKTTSSEFAWFSTSGTNALNLYDYVANATRMVISSAGALRLNTYTAGTLVSDASGNITVSSGGGAGGPYLPLAGGTMTGTNGITMPDNFPLLLGTSGINDSQIFWDGSNIEIQARKANADIVFRSANNSGNLLEFLAIDGGVEKTRAYKDIHFQDNIKATFGDTTSPDLQIYHDGSNSRINETGTGDLIITGGNDILFNDPNGFVYMNMNQSNSVELYYANSKKFETTNTGVAVTGAATATTATTGTDNNATLTTKGYVDGLVTGVPVYRGTWDASGTAGGTPDLRLAANKVLGNYYIVSTAGSATPNGAGTEPDSWNVGDWCIFSDVTPGAGTDLWQKIDNTSVISGAGTGQSVTKWEGTSGATSETLTDGPITFSGNNSTFAGDISIAEKLIHSGDTNTYIQFPGSNDKIVFATNGVDRLTLDAANVATFAGDVTLTNGQLTVTHDTNNVAKIIQSATSMSNATYTFEVDSSSHNSNMSAAGAMAVDVNSGRAFTITGAGKVGIATTDPDKTLTVGGTTAFSGIDIKTKIGSTVYKLWEAEQFFSDEGYQGIYYQNVKKIQFRANGDSYINGGKVGIGTTTPDATTLLDVRGVVQAKDSYFAAGMGNTKGYNFHDLSDNGWGLKAPTSPSRIALFTDTAERLTVLANGNVGIGDTSPSFPLVVSKSSSSTSNGSDASFRFALVNPDQTNNNYALMSFSDGTAQPGSGFFGMQFTDHTNNYGDLCFGTRGASGYGERMRIDSSGRVGIGVTPYAWDTSFDNIQIGNKISLWNASNNGGLSYNQYYNGTNNIYQTNDTANRFQMDADGFHFYQAASGTAGNTATFSESMRITSAGVVQIGPASNQIRINSQGTFENSTLNAHIINANGLGAYGSGDLLIQPRCSSVGSNNIVFGTSGGTNTATEKMRISSAGAIKFNAYGAGTLVTDASGNITVSSGGGAGGPYLPVANPTFTGTITGPNANITGTVTTSRLVVNGTGNAIELNQSSTGAATYYVMDNTVETGGKRWRFGYSGCSFDKSSFSFCNTTDNIMSLIFDGSAKLNFCR